MPGARKRADSVKDREATRRVVLEKVRLAVIPDESGEANFVNEGGEVVEAWVERGEFTGSKTHAIEQFAGKPGTPEAKLGEFKAPPARGWQGGVRHSQPALPKVEREVLK